MAKETTVERTGHNRWAVTIDGRRYDAAYDNDPEVFPLDRWSITNSRGERKAWDDKIADAVQRAIAASPHNSIES